MNADILNTDKKRPALRKAASLLPCLFPVILAACDPTVRVQAPDKPIVINLNVKIDQEVRIRLEKDVEEMIVEDEGLF